MSKKDRILRQRHLLQAEGYLELGMAQHALDVLSHMGSSGDDGAACHLRGEALRTLEDWEGAARELERAAERLPQDIHVLLSLAWCYKRCRKLPQAIEALEQGLAIDSSAAILYYNLACYWSLAHEKDRALEYLTQAFERDASYRDLVSQESDFDSLRGDPDFQSLTSVIV